jgi:hypothetical protein
VEIFVLVRSEENCSLKGSWMLSDIFHGNYYLEARNSTTCCLHQIRVHLSVEFEKKTNKRCNTSQVTTNKLNQLTISKSLPAMTLQDYTSSINCMQQLQLNLTRSRLSPAGCNKTTVWCRYGAQILLSSHILQQLGNGISNLNTN